MKTLIVFLTLTLSITQAFCATFVSNGTGNWSDGPTWVGGVAPPSSGYIGHNIIINAGHTVTHNTTITLAGITTISGTLNMGTKNIAITGYSGQLSVPPTGVLNAFNVILNSSNPAISNPLNGTINAGKSLIIQSSSTVTGSPTITSLFTQIIGNAGSVTFDAGTSLTTGSLYVSNSANLINRGAIDVNGPVTMAGAGKISGSGTVEFDSFSAGHGLGFTCESDGTIETNPMSIYDLQTCDIALPVTYTYVTYNCKNTSLNWQTAQEENNDYFTVQATNDLRNYKSIGQVEGNGNSVISNNYNFSIETDEFNYYRLKQTDYNGDYEYSKIVVNSCYTPNTSNTYIYPTNSNDIFYLNHNFINEEEEITVIITTLTGQLITSSGFTVSNLTKGIDLSTINNGTYIATIKATSFVKSEKIIKI